MKLLITTLCSGLILMVAGAVFAEPVASVVSLRGKATVERGGKALDLQTKLGIELQDTVATTEGARTKLLFIDDSVLTLAEKSRMSIDSFVSSRADRGSSLFNLLDGKMRAVVGKTRFEVKTPTVVAAARGTVILFDVSSQNGTSFTRVTCLEGIVDVRSLTAAPGAKPVMLSPGQSLVVTAKLPAAEQKPAATEQKAAESDKKPAAAEDKPAKSEAAKAPAAESAPAPVATLAPLEPPVMKVDTLSPAEIKSLQAPTNTMPIEIKAPPAPEPIKAVSTPAVVILPPKPPVIPQQPAKTQPTRVDIGVKF